jgi:hypothetical protein
MEEASPFEVCYCIRRGNQHNPFMMISLNELSRSPSATNNPKAVQITIGICGGEKYGIKIKKYLST